MRNPNFEVMKQLQILHQIIKNEFVNMPDESIVWLLGGAPKSRGGFKDAKSFKDFFNKEPLTIPPSRLITALNTIITAIGYRAVDAKWVTPPIQPNANHHHYAYIMHSQIKTKFPRYALPPTIGRHAYTARNLDEVSDECTFVEDYEEILPDDNSEASDVEYMEEKKPQKISSQKFFRKKLHHQLEFSWPVGAQLGNIPIRCHVSGTTPLILAIINQLFESNGHQWIKEEDNVRKLTGALLHPNYERGDYHTLAETSAGVEYYLEARKHFNKAKTTLSPQAAFKYALKHLILATEGTLQDILIKISPLLIEKTQDYPVSTRLELEDYLNIIKTSKDIGLIKQIKDISFIKKIMGPILYEINCSTQYSIAEKIFKFDMVFTLIAHSENRHETVKYACFFTSTQTTSAYQEAMKMLKKALIHALKESEVRELSEKDVLISQKILSTHRTYGPHVFSPSSLSDYHLKKHVSRIS